MISVSEELGSLGVEEKAQARTSWLRRLVWLAAIALATAFFVRDALPYFTITEASYRSFWPNRLWVLMHVCGGSIALFCGLPQFFATLRERHRALHRWTGRGYLVGVVIGVTAAWYMSFHPVLGWTAGVATFCMGLAWLCTTAMAYAAILRRQFHAHREWMIRSYVVTFAFVFFRMLFESPLFSDVGTRSERATALLWVSFVVPPLITEIVLQWRRTMGVQRVA